MAISKVSRLSSQTVSVTLLGNLATRLLYREPRNSLGLYLCSQDSFLKMWDQVDGVQKKISPIISNATDGVNLICYSQGAHKSLPPPSLIIKIILSTVSMCCCGCCRWDGVSRFHRSLPRPQRQIFHLTLQSTSRPVWRSVVFISIWYTIRNHIIIHLEQSVHKVSFMLTSY